jgi:putative spermidine/putrescine transport system permease protein
MLKRRRQFLKFVGIAVVVVLLGFVVLPALVVTLVAFNHQAMLAFPPEEWSWRWFIRALEYRDFRNGFYNGVRVMLFTSTLALVVGAGFAYVIDRYDFRGKTTLEAVLLSPLVIPNFTIGIGFLIFSAQIGMMRTYTVVVATHMVLVLPFVLRSVYVSLKNIDRRLELAASGLGASPGRVLVTVTLPLLVPGLFAGWLFAAILSFNEFTASLFVTAQRTQTLPVAMYNYVREYADPTMAAISVLFIVTTAVLLVFANAFLGLGKVLAIEERR